MCELFGMSSRVETSVNLSMELLARRGGNLGHLGDGWGIGLYDANDARLFREPEAAGDSAWVGFIGTQPIRSRLVMSHLRHATQGEVSLRNTQPFARELGGRMHLFAHNGHLPGLEGRLAGQWGRFRPIGSTDSEIAFCVLLERLMPLWARSEPTLSDRLAVVSHIAEQLREIGPANFLYSDGELLFAHGHRRIQRDGSTAPPGLYLLSRECAVDPHVLAAAGILLGNPQRVTLVASVPLTQEAWRPFGEGEIVVVSGGVVVAA